MTSDPLKIGFVGLGDMGAPMAEQLLAKGWEVSFFARRPEVVERFRALGGVPVSTLRELGEVSDVVEVVVVDDAGVREVVLGDNILAGMRPGSVLAIHSTVHPETCLELESIAAKQDVALVDAPVSGGRWRAETGDLTVLVGADEEVCARVEPVFQAYGSVVRRMGPVGTGQLTKLINNFFSFAHEATARDEARLIQAFGLDLQAAVEVLPTCSGSSEKFKALASWNLVPRIYEKGELVRLDVLDKDLSLIRALAQDAGIDLGLTDGFIDEYVKDARVQAHTEAAALSGA